MGKNKPNKPPAPTTKSKGSPKIVYAGVAMLVGATAVAWQLYGGGAPPKVPEPPKTNRRQTTTTESPKKQQAAAKQQRSKPPSPPPPRPMVSGKVDPNCVDSDESCESWARSGECDRNQGFMHSNCRASCHICNGGKPKPKRANACEDSNTNCATWAAIGECQSNPGFMLQNCPVTCKMCQSETCKDELDDCTARCKGGIASNYSENLNCYYEPELVEKCAWTCGACKEHRFDKPQCERRKGTKPAATPGSVDKMFNRIKDDLPNAFTPGSGTTPSVNVLSSEPWVITIDDFLSSEECDDILKAGSHSGTAWGRSQAGDGVQAARTSSTAWCKGACLQHPTVQRVEQRVSDLLDGIPMDNAEPMQVLKYETGQFYKVHHDQNSPRSSAWGPRMFTVFMYIGDGYEGGLTHFPRLNLTIPAKKGAACVWTSILDSDPYQRDDRTDHESLPVESGVKYGVNYWIHMYPFRSMQNGNCDNQAYIQNWY